MTGDTIKFGSDGLLKDGQNRLSACVQAGVSFKSHTVFGVDPALFARMDVGRNRNASDAFSIAGVPYSADTAAAVRWLVILEGPNPLTRETFTNEFLLKAYRERYSDVSASVGFGQLIRKQWNHPTGAVAALHYLFNKKNRALADEFRDKWASGRWGRRSDPVKLLQDRLQSIKAQNHGRIHDGVRNALIIEAWNSFVTGDRITLEKLQWHLGQTFPVIKG